jgi:hypothetical protein
MPLSILGTHYTNQMILSLLYVPFLLVFISMSEKNPDK